MSRRAMMVAPAGGGGGGSGFRYFRIRTTRTFNGNNTGIATIETREVSGGTDYASGATATASATAGTGFEPDKAIDGNASTFWSTGGATDTDGSNWLALDFGTPRDITEVKITVRPDGFREDPKAFTFQVSSDGTTWTVPTNWFSGSSIT